MTRQICVPRMRMHEIDLGYSHRHFEVNPKSLDGLIGTVKRGWHRMRSCIDAMSTKAVHIHRGQSA